MSVDASPPTAAMVIRDSRVRTRALAGAIDPHLRHAHAKHTCERFDQRASTLTGKRVAR
jgi:hypothetical protein